MYDTIEDRKKVIEEVLKNHNLTIDDISFLSKIMLTDSSSIQNKFDENGFNNKQIISYFKPKFETVDITRIKGLEFDDMDFINSLLNIYRPEPIFENLGEFDFNKFNKSLSSFSSNYGLIEKNGNYYVYQDGNHRTLLMLFQYYLEFAQLKKENAPQEKFDQLKKKYTINVPVLHLDHDKDLLETISGVGKTYFEGLAGDFIGKLLPRGYLYDCYLTKNENSTYDIYYKGVKKENCDKKEIIDTISAINSINLDNYFLYDNGAFVICNEHIGAINVPKEKLFIMDKKISELELKDIGIDYFINVDYKTKNISLHFAQKDFGARYDIDNRSINEFRDKHKDIFGDSELIDSFGYMDDLHYDNITMEEAKKIIGVMKELNTIATKKSTR